MPVFVRKQMFLPGPSPVLSTFFDIFRRFRVQTAPQSQFETQKKAYVSPGNPCSLKYRPPLSPASRHQLSASHSSAPFLNKTDPPFLWRNSDTVEST